MLKYNEWGKHLRLGNYLFQYATIASICKTNNLDVEFPKNYFLWNYLKTPPILTEDRNYEEEIYFYDYLYFGYNEENKKNLIEYLKQNKNRTLNISVNASFQSEKWFIENVDYVKEILEIKEEEKIKIREKYQSFFLKKTIGIGIRRGDFVDHGSFYQIPMDWYERALNSIFPDWKENYNIVVFSDDIEWCKRYFQGRDFLFADSNNTYKLDNENYFKDPMEQFILGTLMDNFIGGNSTFSWWQMWYVKNFNNGTVVHCGKNLSDREAARLPNPMFYSDSWKLYEI